MDPTSCLYNVLEMLEHDDREAAIESMHDLIDWLNNGGFVPQVRSTEMEKVTETGIQKSAVWVVKHITE